MEIKWKFPEMVGRLLIFVLLGCIIVSAAPTTRPLEHSPSDLAWDAWLRHGSGQVHPPRRITTKSLFVFPNLGAEALPACADGYRPDSMGRCVKEVKVDETAHLEFLLQKLNSQFATETSEGQDEAYDYDIETDPPDNSGPFQFSIPLALSSSVSKSQDNVPGEIVTLSKKDPHPPSSDTVHTKPTSSPEVVPEYNDRKQFFHGGSPAASESVLQQNSSDTAGAVSVLLRNSTSTGITLLIPSNGNFQNISEPINNENKSDLQKELESIKVNHIKTNPEVLEIKFENKTNKVTFPISPESVTQLSEKVTIIEKPYSSPSTVQSTNTVTYETDLTSEDLKNHKTYILNINYTNGLNKTANIHEHEINTINLVNNTNDSLVNQIEALKSPPIMNDIPDRQAIQENQNNFNAIEQHLKNHMPDTKIVSQSTELPKINKLSDALDIEEKIKLISRFADVSRNTENYDPNIDSHYQKNNPNDHIRFPSVMFADENVEINHKIPPDLAPAPSSLVRFPTHNAEDHPPHHAFFGIQPPLETPYQNFQQLPIYEKNHDNEKSFWLPFGWDINRNPEGEHSLMEFWSKMPSAQRYPYNARLQQNHHESHFPVLFPNSHETGGRMNIRHASMNFRQGRDSTEVLQRGQMFQDDSMNYKRSHHPNSRESEELSRILEAYNGR